jgi:hypothetical protein
MALRCRGWRMSTPREAKREHLPEVRFLKVRRATREHFPILFAVSTSSFAFAATSLAGLPR